MSLKIIVLEFVVLSDFNDFNNTVIRITFDPDESTPHNEHAAPIAVFNDLINEADEQVFIVKLRLVNSTNADAVNLSTRPASLCKIIDDDRKLNNMQCSKIYFVYYINCLIV